MPQQHEAHLPPMLLTVAQVSEILGLGRTKVYELIACERLPVIRFGRAVRISRDSLQQWVEQREQRDQAG